MKQFVLLIKGASGSGKTTLARKVFHVFGKDGEKVAIIHGDYLISMIYSEKITPEILDMKYENMADVVANFLAGGYSLIVNDLMRRQEDLNLLLEKTKEFAVAVVVNLFAPPEVLKSRTRARDLEDFVGDKLFQEFYGQAINVHYQDEVFIDTSAEGADVSAERIVEVLKGKGLV